MEWEIPEDLFFWYIPVFLLFFIDGIALDLGDRLKCSHQLPGVRPGFPGPDCTSINPGYGSDFCGSAGTDHFICRIEIKISDILFLYRYTCLLYTSPSPRDRQKSRMPSS